MVLQQNMALGLWSLEICGDVTLALWAQAISLKTSSDLSLQVVYFVKYT